jgi:hypothetical protein
LSAVGSCAPGGAGAAGGGPFGGAGGGGGGYLSLVAATMTIAGEIDCSGDAGSLGEFDDGGGGGGSGGCVHLSATSLAFDSGARLTVAGGAGGEGGYCPVEICGGLYCGGGGGGGGGGGLFVACDDCTLDGASATASALLGSAAVDAGGALGAPRGDGADGPCDPPAEAGEPGANGITGPG